MKKHSEVELGLKQFKDLKDLRLVCFILTFSRVQIFLRNIFYNILWGNSKSFNQAVLKLRIVRLTRKTNGRKKKLVKFTLLLLFHASSVFHSLTITKNLHHYRRSNQTSMCLSTFSNVHCHFRPLEIQSKQNRGAPARLIKLRIRQYWRFPVAYHIFTQPWLRVFLVEEMGKISAAYSFSWQVGLFLFHESSRDRMCS